MNYLAIALGFIIIVGSYYVYRYVTNNTLTSGLQPLNTVLSFTYDKLTNPNSYTYSYQFWVYLSQTGVKDSQIPVFYRGADINKPEFAVYIKNNTLTLSAGSGTVAPTQIMTITQNFPIQKWVYLVINVYNLQTFEAYLNGKLVKTVNYDTTSKTILTPDSKTSPLLVGDTRLTGYTTKFIRIADIINAKTVWNNYLSGNGLNNYLSSIPYGLNISIYSGEDLQNVVKVF